jgi:hypothetical protein
MTTYPFGYRPDAMGVQGMGEMLEWEQLVTRATVNRLHPEFLRRVAAMCKAAAGEGVPLGIGTGWRVQPTNKKGFAAPGNSNHEGFPVGPESVGAVAADMVPSPSWDWMEANCARFGLRTFRHVNDEPWHCQPAEIPAGRSHRTKPWTLAPFDLADESPATHPKGDDVVITLFQCVDADAAFVGASANGVGVHVSWVTGEMAARYRAVPSVVQQAISIGQLQPMVLLGPIPSGDTRHAWSGDEFAAVVS